MQPFYLPCSAGNRFCLFYQASGDSLGAVLYVHPFAEEMNKSRRMAAMQARELATAGFDVLQIDLLGCGDSSGDFSDATWRAWLDDVLAGYSGLRTRSAAPLILWGLRVGCLLAAEVASKIPEQADFVFWQPVISGKQYWQQFMRLKMVGEMAAGQAKVAGERLRQQLTAGQAVEIAGYGISPALAMGLEQAELSPPTGQTGRVFWIETSQREELSLSPIAMKQIEQWRGAGYPVYPYVVRGPSFWQTTELEDAPELIAATLSALAKN